MIGSLFLDDANDGSDDAGNAENGAADSDNPPNNDEDKCLACVFVLAHAVVAAAGAAVASLRAAADGAAIWDAKGVTDPVVDTESSLAAG